MGARRTSVVPRRGVRRHLPSLRSAPQVRRPPPRRVSAPVRRRAPPAAGVVQAPAAPVSVRRCRTALPAAAVKSKLLALFAFIGYTEDGDNIGERAFDVRGLRTVLRGRGAADPRIERGRAAGRRHHGRGERGVGQAETADAGVERVVVRAGRVDRHIHPERSGNAGAGHRTAAAGNSG